MNGVENNGRSRGGCTRHGFLPGQSGNPGGRPKGLAALVRAQTKDGKELVDLMLRVLRGKFVVNGRKPNISERMKAAEWLADRGWGKSVETHAIEVPDEAEQNLQQAIAVARLLARERMGIETIDEAEARQTP